MSREYIRGWWRRLCQRLPWRRQGRPVWGEEPPAILGICRECGAVVLEGWHREEANGLLCRRCAGLKDRQAHPSRLKKS